MYIGRHLIFDKLDSQFERAIRMECSAVSNRYLCDVLSEMRTCHETRNYAHLVGLIEECQTLANRMETALMDKRNVLDYEARRPVLKDEIKELEWRKAELEEKCRKLEFRMKEIKHDHPELKKGTDES
jgi:predicted nuclease with TOPRIM domain